MNKTLKSKALRLMYENGTTASGKTKYSAFSISNISKTADENALYGLKALLEKVQNRSIASIGIGELYKLSA